MATPFPTNHAEYYRQLLERGADPFKDDLEPMFTFFWDRNSRTTQDDKREYWATQDTVGAVSVGLLVLSGNEDTPLESVIRVVHTPFRVAKTPGIPKGTDDEAFGVLGGGVTSADGVDAVVAPDMIRLDEGAFATVTVRCYSFEALRDTIFADDAGAGFYNPPADGTANTADVRARCACPVPPRLLPILLETSEGYTARSLFRLLLPLVDAHCTELGVRAPALLSFPTLFPP